MSTWWLDTINMQTPWTLTRDGSLKIRMNAGSFYILVSQFVHTKSLWLDNCIKSSFKEYPFCHIVLECWSILGSWCLSYAVVPSICFKMWICQDDIRLFNYVDILFIINLMSICRNMLMVTGVDWEWDSNQRPPWNILKGWNRISATEVFAMNIACFVWKPGNCS